jgi:hypothetical protein
VSQLPISWFCRFMTSGLRKFATSELRRFEIPDLRKFATSGLRRFKILDLHKFGTSGLRRFKDSRSSQVHDFGASRFQIFAGSRFLKTHFTNFIQIDVSRMTGFPEFPNSFYRSRANTFLRNSRSNPIPPLYFGVFQSASRGGYLISYYLWKSTIC